MGRKRTPIHVIVHRPRTKEGQRELAKRVAEIHADAAARRIQALNCPEAQKKQLWDAIIKSVSDY